MPPPIELSFSCDLIAASAKQRGLFLPAAPENKNKVRPGSLFLVRHAADDWHHVGIVRSVDGDLFGPVMAGPVPVGRLRREALELRRPVPASCQIQR